MHNLSLTPTRQIEVSHEDVTRVEVARVATPLRPSFVVALTWVWFGFIDVENSGRDQCVDRHHRRHDRGRALGHEGRRRGRAGRRPIEDRQTWTRPMNRREVECSCRGFVRKERSSSRGERRLTNDCQSVAAGGGDGWSRVREHPNKNGGGERLQAAPGCPVPTSSSHDEIAAWFDAGLRQLRDEKILDRCGARCGHEAPRLKPRRLGGRFTMPLANGIVFTP